MNFDLCRVIEELIDQVIEECGKKKNFGDAWERAKKEIRGLGYSEEYIRKSYKNKSGQTIYDYFRNEKYRVLFDLLTKNYQIDKIRKKEKIYGIPKLLEKLEYFYGREMRMMNKERLGQKIANRREYLGMYQEEVAEEAGIELKTLQEIETSCEWSNSLETYEKIAVALGWTLADMFCDSQLYDEDVDEMTLDRAYYLNHDKYGRISTIGELMVILPLIDEADLVDILIRFGGDLFGNEDYISSLWTNRFRRLPNTPAKRYAQHMLYSIYDRPWKAFSDRMPSDILRSRFEETFDEANFNDYMAKIYKRKKKLEDERLRSLSEPKHI